MGKVQLRRSVSIPGPLYDEIAYRAKRAGITPTTLITEVLTAKFGPKPTPEERLVIDTMNRMAPHPDLVAAVKAVRREAAAEVEAAAKAVRALPAESKIVAGPPPEQTAFLGRVETPPGSLRAIKVDVPPADRVKGTDPAPHLNALKARRWLQDGAARAALARREAKGASVAIRSGFEEKANVEQARPHGQRIEVSRGERGTVLW